VLAGQQRAKANGVKLGRPSKMNDGMRSAVKLLREKGTNTGWHVAYYLIDCCSAVSL
jgi:hypothetical protein